MLSSMFVFIRCPREDLQGVYIETSRLVHPLSLVHAWWAMLARSLKFLVKQIGSVMGYAIGIYEQILQQITQITTIINSVECISDVADVREADRGAV